jgi:hypothetical protein
MAHLVRCRRCSALFPTEARQPPDVCVECAVVLRQGPTLAPVSDEPRHAWELTGTDSAFLKSIRIASEA